MVNSNIGAVKALYRHCMFQWWGLTLILSDTSAFRQ